MAGKTHIPTVLHRDQEHMYMYMYMVQDGHLWLIRQTMLHHDQEKNQQTMKNTCNTSGILLCGCITMFLSTAIDTIFYLIRSTTPHLLC